MVPDLLFDRFSQHVPRNVHQRVFIVGVLIHAGQARIVMVQHARLELGCVCTYSHQFICDKARAATTCVALDGDRRNLARKWVNLDLKRRAAKVTRELGDEFGKDFAERVLITNFYGDHVGRSVDIHVLRARRAPCGCTAKRGPISTQTIPKLVRKRDIVPFFFAHFVRVHFCCTPLAANTIVAGEEWGTAIVRYHGVKNFFSELIDVCFWTKAEKAVFCPRTVCPLLTQSGQ